MSEIEWFPILVSSYRMDDEVRELRKAGGTAIVVQIPLAMIAPHEKQAMRNHSQTLKRLAERGGLGADEAVAVLEDRSYARMHPATANARLMNMTRKHFAALRADLTTPEASS
ncbi:hypothetical protein LB518_23045 [Mesorhizobium sp. BR1-1-16]|uniref:hypothetical protein n=1 Tax=Mesorhizobium sp. BR1-1-16 TaxID=2876653 RepID=UPI001CCA2BDE|nr:hypothetical protein [Mesorhizobium sp. BR1-1-16]MBZ9939193.1 hypothetical protein [Mesorhizobium sp. BR1-1-16]